MIPPIVGAAMRFITSPPAPTDHIIGSSPNSMQATVMTFGRSRFTAPTTMASRRSSQLFMRPCDLPGYLAARLGDYIVEFRNKDRWDAAIPRSAVLIHRFEDNHSYLMSANNGQQDLVAGSTFGDDPAKGLLNLFANITRLEVIEINDTDESATIRLEHRSVSVQNVGPRILFGGVAQGGDGCLVYRGKVCPYSAPLTSG